MSHAHELNKLVRSRTQGYQKALSKIQCWNVAFFKLGHGPIIPSYQYAKNSKLICQRNRDMSLQRCTTAKAN